MRSFSLDERMKGDDELSSKGRRKLDANLLKNTYTYLKLFMNSKILNDYTFLRAFGFS